MAAAGYVCDAQVALKANEEYLTAEGRRKAAFEMDHWIRPSVERTSELIASLSLTRGEIIADVGAGTGYLLPYLVESVGRDGAVFAVDIYPDFLAKAQERIKAAGWENVFTVLGTERDPALPRGQLDVVILLDTYHHLSYPAEMLQHGRRALKPNGRLIIIDFYRSRKHPVTPDEELRRHIRIDRGEVVAEAEAQGFRQTSGFDHLPHEYVLIFQKGGRDEIRR